MEGPDIDDLIEEQWEIAVGKAVLANADIEYLTTYLYQEWFRDRGQRTFIRKPQSARLDCLCNLISKKSDITREDQTKLMEIFLRAKKLLERRNIIAHSPFSGVTFKNGSKVIGFELGTASVKGKGQYLTYDTLIEFVQESESVYKDFVHTFKRLNDKPGNFWNHIRSPEIDVTEL